MDPESETSKENYHDNKFFYNKELIETTNLLLGIGFLVYLVFKKIVSRYIIMNKKESEVNYMNLDKNNIRSVNNILMFVYYGFLIVFFYQFFNSKKNSKKALNYF